jgi:hypothetical protein
MVRFENASPSGNKKAMSILTVSIKTGRRYGDTAACQNGVSLEPK